MNEKYMIEALKEARKALDENEVPIGAVIVYNGEIIARAYNHKVKNNDATCHAEIEAIKEASEKLGTWYLNDCSLYVTLEPCPMCAGAIMQSRIQHVYYGAYDKSGGALGSLFNLYEIKGFNHYPYIHGGIMEEECGALLTSFFKMKRIKK